MTSNQKIRAIVDAMELYEQIDMQLLAARDLSARNMQTVQDDLVRRYGSVFPPEAMTRMDKLSSAFGRQIADIWNTEGFVALFAAEYGCDMEDDDLDQILTYYTSSAGRKDVRSAKTAIAITFGALLNLRQEQFDPALRAYNAEAQRIFAEFGPTDM